MPTLVKEKVQFNLTMSSVEVVRIGSWIVSILPLAVVIIGMLV